jgi:hypothetical protein
VSSRRNWNPIGTLDAPDETATLDEPRLCGGFRIAGGADSSPAQYRRMTDGLRAKPSRSLLENRRYPLVNAAGTAGLVALAPGRVAVAFGTGFGMRVVGQREVTWSYLEANVNAFRGLLKGQTVVWEGARLWRADGAHHYPQKPTKQHRSDWRYHR